MRNISLVTVRSCAATLQCLHERAPSARPLRGPLVTTMSARKISSLPALGAVALFLTNCSDDASPLGPASAGASSVGGGRAATGGAGASAAGTSSGTGGVSAGGGGSSSAGTTTGGGGASGGSGGSGAGTGGSGGSGG